MATKTTAPATGQLYMHPLTFQDVVQRLKDAATRNGGLVYASIRTHNRQVLIAGGDAFEALVELTPECAYEGRLAACVDLKALQAAAKVVSRNAESVVLEQQAKGLRITTPGVRGVTRIKLLEREPLVLPEYDTEQLLAHGKGSELTAAIAKVAHAASRDDTRPLLQALLLESGPQTGKHKGPHVAATDSFRLFAHPLPGAADRDFRVATFAAGMVAATKSLTDDEGVVVSKAGDRVEVLRNGERWLIPTPAGVWPQWRQFIPTEAAIRVTIEVAELAEPLAAAHKHQGSDASMTWKVPATVEAGKRTDGLAREFGLNPRFLGHAVAALDAEKIRLSYVGPTRPLALTAGTAVGIIMPIRLDGEGPKSKDAVPLRIEISDAGASGRFHGLTLRMDAYKPPPKPGEQPAGGDAKATAKDLADVTGVAKRSGK